MSAQIFDPATLSMTDRARTHIKRQLERESATALLLGITESGCNGYMYELSYIDAEPDDASRVEFDDGVLVFIQKDNWELVTGTEIDYVTEGLNSMLKFNNPNAETLCGCGESFSVSGT